MRQVLALSTATAFKASSEYAFPLTLHSAISHTLAPRSIVTSSSRTAPPTVAEIDVFATEKEHLSDSATGLEKCIAAPPAAEMLLSRMRKLARPWSVTAPNTIPVAAP